MLHASDHLSLPIYQLICLSIYFLLLSIHLYFLHYNIWVDSVLRPVRIVLYIEFLFFRLGFYCLTKGLKILIIWSHGCLWRRLRILLGCKFGADIGSSTSISCWTFPASWFCPCFNNSSCCVCLLFWCCRSFQTRLSGSLWTRKCHFFFFKG